MLLSESCQHKVSCPDCWGGACQSDESRDRVENGSRDPERLAHDICLNFCHFPATLAATDFVLLNLQFSLTRSGRCAHARGWICEIFPQTVCPHSGVLAVGVRSPSRCPSAAPRFDCAISRRVPFV